ncbi:MAG: hypothetical protein ACE5MI_11775 [Acidimicrobiia bacterium]
MTDTVANGGRFRAAPSRPKVGDTSPSFTLRRTFEESMDLGELLTKGPVLLVFYVFDFGDY